MRTLVATHPPASAPTVALLSGAFGEPEDFLREGFVDAARASGFGAELVLAGLRAGEFADGTVVERIRDDIVAPARARGRRTIWLAGISLGGLAAIAYAARYARELAGILLLSPYPSTRPVLREMALASRSPSALAAISADGDLEREAWLWLLARGDARPPVFCYFTSGDRFAPGQRQLAATLPSSRVHEIDGGHDWPAWRALWTDFLAHHGADIA